MSDQVTFRWVDIENFRGFRDQQRIDIDGSAVVLSGHNGTGKTSFFDALQWLLVGSLERLEPWRSRRNTEHIANVFSEGPAKVSAGIQVGATPAEIRRHGRHDSGFLEWSDANGTLLGKEAEQRLLASFSTSISDIDALRRTLMRSGLLQQDVVRIVLEEKGSERYEALAGLLGLDAIAAFDRATRRRADQAALSGRQARQALQDGEARRDGLLRRMADLRARAGRDETTESAVAVATNSVAALGPTVRFIQGLPSDPDTAVRVSGSVGDVASTLTGLVERLRSVEAQFQGVRRVEDAEVAAARGLVAVTKRAADKAARDVRALEMTLREATATNEAYTTLAATALPLLTETCPVCTQRISKADVQVHLDEVTARSGTRLAETRQELDRARALADHAREEAKAAAAAETELSTAAATFAAREAERDAQTRAARAEIQTAIGALHALGISSSEEGHLEAGDGTAILTLANALRTTSRILTELAAALRDAASAPGLSRLTTQVDTLSSDLEVMAERARDASIREERARTLQRAGARASAAVADRRFRLLAPLVGDIFGRLDPHPVFKSLDFELGVYRERGVADPIVRDIETGIDADPLLVFSSSQMNVAALAYFLAFGWASGREAMPFVLLDDPLQSLDDVNALGFSDLCRHIRRQRQLILSTHDRRLADLLERKLAPRSPLETTVVLEFGPWSRKGPSITRRVVEPQLREGTERLLVAAA